MNNRSSEETILEIRSRYPDAKYVILFAPSFDWEPDATHRLQYLARALARRGALVFYLQLDRTDSHSFSEVEERLVITKAPVDTFRVLTDAFVYVLPWNIPLLAYLSSPRVIYDYFDDLSTFEGDVQQLRRDHDDYLLKADVVLTSAKHLYNHAVVLRPDTVWLPNGVDYELFSLSSQIAPPLELAAILQKGRRIIGYHGDLTRWFDCDLVKYLAKARRDLSFVLIGNDPEQILSTSGLLEEPNIHWLERRPHQQLAEYIGNFNISILPFIINDITNSSFPNQLFESFAAGKPIVSSALEEAKLYPQVLIAEEPEMWLQKIDRALDMSSDTLAKQSLQLVGAKNTWDIRANEIWMHLDGVLNRPQLLPWYARLKPKNPFFGKLLQVVIKVIKILRISGFTGLLKGVFYKSYDFFSSKRLLLLAHVARAFEDTYIPEDNSQVTLFTDRMDLFPEYWPRHLLDKAEVRLRPMVAVILACKDESLQVSKWIACLSRQTLLPDEVIVVDMGSKDGTVDSLLSASEEYRLPINIIQAVGVNLAAARNRAIQESASQVVVLSDIEYIPHDDWLEKLTQPFRVDPKIEVSAGWHRTLDVAGKEAYFYSWPDLGGAHLKGFVPSTLSLALTKTAWEKAGGYPDWLAMGGEDTYFVLELKRYCTHWAFVPEAVVDWVMPLTWWRRLKKSYHRSGGDGETGYNALVYKTLLFQTLKVGLGTLVGTILLGYGGWLVSQGYAGSPWIPVGILIALSATVAAYLLIKKGDLFLIPDLVGSSIAKSLGFIAGAIRKQESTLRKLRKSKGLYIILAGVPIDDTGGGARCTQIALELLRQGYWVVYINRFPKWETRNLGIKFGHPNLFLFEWDRFNWDEFSTQYKAELILMPKFALVEIPTADFLALIDSVRRSGGRIIYEMIDDWNSSLGGVWYSTDIEKQIIDSSHNLIATAQVLQKKLAEMSGRQVDLLPNAVNSLLFNPDRIYRRPDDLPLAEWTAAYIGALWGDWFDWDLLVRLANQYPKAAIVVIGDYDGQCPTPPNNLKFLGLKPQTALPAYLAHVDVAIIPWKDNNITQATSPLKIYEYLAMNRPVVAPNLNPLKNIPGVFLAKDQDDFIRLVDVARMHPLELEKIRDFIHHNDWRARVIQLTTAGKDR